MLHFRNTLGTTAILMMTTSASFADVTPQQVWDNAKSLMGVYGDISTDAETVSGDVLSITGIEMNMVMPEGSTKTTMDTIKFRDLGNGTVAIEFGDSHASKVAVKGDNGEEVDVDMIFTQEGLSVIASGDPSKIDYAFSAPTMTYDITTSVAGVEDFASEMVLVMNGMSGNYLVSGDDLQELEYTTVADELVMSGSFNAGGENGMTFGATFSDLKSDAKGAIPEVFDQTDFVKTLQNGFAMDSKTTMASSDYTVSVNDNGSTTNIKGESGAGDFLVNMNNDAIEYGFASNDMKVSVSGSAIPLPSVDLELGDYGFNLLMPVAPSDAPQDFGLSFRLGDLKVSDLIWGMFDPTEQLNREPATIDIALDGQANWLVNIFDPEAQASAEVPAELHAVTLSGLEVSIGGAKLTGNGDFTFDNTDLESFDGMPKPEGDASFKLTGANALLDSLVGVGIIPEEQAFGARMMMGLFGQAVEGEDTMTSTVKVDAEGGVYANGQRLR